METGKMPKRLQDVLRLVLIAVFAGGMVAAVVGGGRSAPGMAAGSLCIHGPASE